MWKNQKATMFVWAPLPDGYTNSEEFALSLLKECGILVTPEVHLEKRRRRLCSLCFGTAGRNYREGT